MTTSAPAGLLGAVEAGGTKVNLAVGTAAGDVIDRARVETTTPQATMAAMLRFFEPHRSRLKAFGVASFGPVRLDRSAPDWGCLLTTPKPGWSGASFVHPLIETFARPVALDTDVNAAALAEHRFGALKGQASCAYLTVGTGVGGGLILGGAPVHGVLHPEVGHLRVIRSPSEDDGFAGCCPYHGDCLEGLASGPAIEKRWKASLSDLPAGHPAHALIADYLGQACATLALTLSVGRIAIGGGVSHAPGLHARVADRMKPWLGGYLADGPATEPGFIARPTLNDQSGVVGALLLAEQAAATQPI